MHPQVGVCMLLGGQAGEGAAVGLLALLDTTSRYSQPLSFQVLPPSQPGITVPCPGRSPWLRSEGHWHRVGALPREEPQQTRPSEAPQVESVQQMHGHMVLSPLPVPFSPIQELMWRRPYGALVEPLWSPAYPAFTASCQVSTAL